MFRITDGGLQADLPASAAFLEKEKPPDEMLASGLFPGFRILLKLQFPAELNLA